jgi:hypothetical protein
LENVTQPTCALATGGSFVISNFDLNNIYDIVPSASNHLCNGIITAAYWNIHSIASG